MKNENNNLYNDLESWANEKGLTADEVIQKAVDEFYIRAMKDIRLYHFFEDVDIEVLKRHQYNFMNKLFNGEEAGGYTSEKLFKIHKNLIVNRGLRPIHFDYFIDNFMSALREIKLDSQLMSKIQDHLVPFRSIFTSATTFYTMSREERLFFALDDDADDSIPASSLSKALSSSGLITNDDRLFELFRQLEANPSAYLEPKRFSQIVGTSGLLVERALQGGLAIPDFVDFSKNVDRIFEEVQYNRSGEQASYIPPLAEVDPDQFGIAIVTIDGQVYQKGDHDVDFSIQSMCKPFNYCFALEDLGAEEVHRHVGTEPSGRAFNNRDLMSRLFKNKPNEELEEVEIPFNPMINAGAIMTAALVRIHDPYETRLRHIREQLGRLIGRKIEDINSIKLPRFNKEMARQENFTGHNNIALGFLLKATGMLPYKDNKFPQDDYPENTDNYEFFIEPSVINALKLYFSTCSIELTATEVAIAAATLANGGVCPMTQERVLQQSTVRSCLSVTQMCGMYDGSGDFFYNIGLPAKSGVGGGVLLVVPKLMGVCIFSPRLDPQGNSVRGIEMAKRLIDEYRLHIYDGVMTDKDRADPSVPLARWRASQCSEALWAASKGDIRTLERLLGEQFNLELGDYDQRTPMHLAAAEGHAEVIEFLLKHGVKPIIDRWGGYPISDARENGHTEIVELFEKMNLPKSTPFHLVEDPNGLINSSTKFGDDLSVVELLWAASENNISGIRRLVAQGVPVHAEDYDKRTALHLAAAEGQLDTVKYLVAHGHPLNVRDRWHATPIDEARREERYEVEKYLKNVATYGS